MHSLDDLLHPISPEQFRAEYVGRKPLHIPAAGDERKAAILTWADFNRLLGQGSLWSAAHLRLMRNYVAVPRNSTATPSPRRRARCCVPGPRRSRSSCPPVPV